ncbi:MAG TPA: phosphatidylserine/phosphatidylglycerophosphate/cardiolipin synthase family protein [Longimicrobiales bacterium]|nr:phosphatidylserine/phosphatidylglycerophosphate/cardiolipin synthase family protein [Longimicrobiales bacterium]
MRYEILVDSGAFWARLRGDIRNARGRVWVQALTVEGDATGRALAAQLHRSPAPDRRLLIDHFTNVFHSDRFVYAPHNLMNRALRLERATTGRMVARLQREGVPVRFTNPPGRMLQRLAGRDHKKLILVDDDVAYVGGINFSDHNFAWHDLMLRITGRDAVSFLEGAYNATWEGQHSDAWLGTPDLDLFNLDGAGNEAGCARLLELMRGAREHVYIQSPYITFPFTEALGCAVENGARVTILSPAANNRGFMTRYIADEARRRGFELRTHEGMSHLKAMLIDDRQLILGSTNFDWLTYHHLAEFVAVIRDEGVVADYRARVLAPDLAQSVIVVPAAPRRASHVEELSGLAAQLQVHALSRLAAVAQGV